jgi:hypothetical protein
MCMASKLSRNRSCPFNLEGQGVFAVVAAQQAGRGGDYADDDEYARDAGYDPKGLVAPLGLNASLYAGGGGAQMAFGTAPEAWDGR